MVRSGSSRSSAAPALVALALGGGALAAGCSVLLGLGDVPEPPPDAAAGVGPSSERHAGDVHGSSGGCRRGHRGRRVRGRRVSGEASPCGDTLASSTNCGQCGHGCLGAGCVMGACQPFTLVATDAGVAPGFMAQDDAYLYWTDNGRSTVSRTDKVSAATAVLHAGDGLSRSASPWTTPGSALGRRRWPVYTCPKVGCPLGGVARLLGNEMSAGILRPGHRRRRGLLDRGDEHGPRRPRRPGPRGQEPHRDLREGDARAPQTRALDEASLRREPASTSPRATVCSTPSASTGEGASPSGRPVRTGAPASSSPTGAHTGPWATRRAGRSTEPRSPISRRSPQSPGCSRARGTWRPTARASSGSRSRPLPRVGPPWAVLRLLDRRVHAHVARHEASSRTGSAPGRPARPVLDGQQPRLAERHLVEAGPLGRTP